MGIAIANRKNRCDFGALRYFQEPLNAPFLDGLFSQRILKRETALSGTEGKRPIKVGKRPIKAGKIGPLMQMGRFRAPRQVVENGPSGEAH